MNEKIRKICSTFIAPAIIKHCLCLLALGLIWSFYPQKAFAGDEIHVLYDSETNNQELKVGWGFAALIRRKGINILVDTGWHEHILKHNIQKLGHSPADIDYIVITHKHPDHYGGLRYLLSENPAIKVYLPADFDRKAYPAEWKINYVKKQHKIAEGLHVVQTNPDAARFGIEEELSLVIETKPGAVIVSGCFHTGWANLIKTVNENISKKIYLMVGGGRFIDLAEKELVDLAESLNALKLENVGLAHCASGMLPDRVFKDRFGKHSIYSRLGSIIPIPD